MICDSRETAAEEIAKGHRFRFVIAFDHPYYPDITYCDTPEEVEEVTNQTRGNGNPDGEYNSLITVSELRNIETLKTAY